MVKHFDHTEYSYNNLWDVYFSNEDSRNILGSKGRSRVNRKSTHYQASRFVLGLTKPDIFGMPGLVTIISLD